jgi:hypothetical protein
MAQVLGFESNGGRTSTGLEGSPGGVRLLSFCLIGEVVPDSDISAFRWVLDRYVLILRSHNGNNEP